MKPFLDRAANGMGYTNPINRYIYSFADELYEELLGLSGKEGQDDNNIVELAFHLGVFDLHAPTWVKVETAENCVTWTAYCEYDDWFAPGELPAFCFDIDQYREALEKLKALWE
jgi:hypothetical protein